MEASRPTREDLPSGARWLELDGLRVALVHDWLTGRRGGEKCLEVLCQTFPKATLHTLIHVPGTAGQIIDSMSIRTSPLQHVPGVSKHYRALLPLMPLATHAWNIGRPDLVVSFSHCVAKAVRVPRGIPHVCYCFTPMRYAWSGRAAYLDHWSKRSPRRAVAGWMLDRLRNWDRRTAQGVTQFVAISHTVSKRIDQCYGRESHVIQPPVDVDYFRPAPLPRDEFYLVVSALVPYKRVEHAVVACSASQRRLIVIGAGPERARLEAMAGSGTTFMGWQPDSVVRDHLRRCRALLFPGEEDFGILPMEALACGAPVIAYGAGGVAETVDNSVGRLYDFASSECLGHAIQSWEAEGCPHDPVGGRERSVAFAVPAFRARLLSCLADVVRGRTLAATGVPRPHLASSWSEQETRTSSGPAL